MTRDSIQFLHDDSPPATDVTVYDSLTRQFLGTEFTFRVVGSSHYVTAPAYNFYELSSCEPVPAATRVELDPSLGRRTLTFETDGLRCETVLDRRPLAAFFDENSGDLTDSSFDLSHEFAEDAVTTVDVCENCFETYHTYPEFDLTLFSRTTFESVPDE